MANTYNYLEAIKADVREWIEYNTDLVADIENGNYNDINDIIEDLNDKLWIEDSVTGNASGSYTFSTWEAEENLCHNWDEIEDAAANLGLEAKITDGYEYGPEWWDVTIRCNLLNQAIAEVLEEIEEDINEAIEARDTVEA